MTKKSFMVLAALALALGTCSFALAWGYDPPAPPAPVYTQGVGDAKIAVDLNASGVAGEITDIQSEKGIQHKQTESFSASGDGAIGVNEFDNNGRIRPCVITDRCDREGTVAIARFELDVEKIKTDSWLCVDNKKTATVLQNTANMNGTLIAGLNLCGVPGKVEGSGEQTFTQSIVNAILPVTHGSVNSLYIGKTRFSANLGN